MTDETKTPAPGIPWGLIFQILQTILAIITYLAKRETHPAGRAELARIGQSAKAALDTAERAIRGADK